MNKILCCKDGWRACADLLMDFWPRMASEIYYSEMNAWYIWRQCRRKLSGYVFLLATLDSAIDQFENGTNHFIEFLVLWFPKYECLPRLFEGIGIEDIPVILAYDRDNKRMNFERVSNTTRRKICQLSAIDYFAVSIMSYRPNVNVLSRVNGFPSHQYQTSSWLSQSHRICREWEWMSEWERNAHTVLLSQKGA
jgi:hypothetical protein